MKLENKCKIEALRQGISLIKDQIMNLSHDKDNSHYITNQQRIVGLQMAVVILADLKYEIEKETE